MANDYMDQWNVNGELWDIHDKDRGIPNGVATLDGDGRIPYSQLPESAMEFKGYWDANTNTPTLADGTGTKGDFYITDTAGTQDLGSGIQYFAIGDRVLYDGSVWKNIDRGVVHSVSEIAPDNTGAVDLSQQTDMRKVLNKDIIYKLLGERGVACWKKDKNFTSPNHLSSHGLSYANGLWVTGTNTNGGIWWSEDNGDTWYRGTGDIANNAYIKRTAYGNGIWVAFDASSWKTYWSEDGKTWTEGTGDTVPPGVGLFLGYIGGIWLCGTQTDTYWSEDGKAWQICIGLYAQSIARIYYANGIFECGSYWSEDGKTWTQGTNSSTLTASKCYANGLWLSTSANGIWWSEDGKSWTQGTGNASFTSKYTQGDIVYAVGVYVCGTSGAGYFYSNDGKTWTQCTGNTSDYVLDIQYHNGVFVATSNDSKGVWWSRDGITWTQSTGVLTNKSSKRLAYANGIWLCIQENIVWYSINGVDWKSTSLRGITISPDPLVYGNGVWMAGASYYDGIWHTSYDWLFE